MELSLFLARFLGVYFLILGGIWIIRREQFEATAKQIVSSNGLLAITGAINLMLGLFIVIGQPIWELSFRGVITLLGYLFIIGGIMRLGFPATVQKIAPEFMGRLFWLGLAFLFVIGIFLLYSGFVRL